eukprot:CAMPEP_0181255208 /NCGR_PEP_ID=MMETSP1096-20121128/49023_1 /TAXON_ID=156174 ORGANISM="Chrysochromulina ericina, Strain CCMP281" /NCGR_SAMPLE_ID=MMETSP1096 /ASSEMBLY_ACC=CAM_ASM_000453 /LENGTH=94 /DNA_ID=CAMNT_0023353313 /DNA_START=257 /DNA_END=538 /DNA_ORIENTATION=+
MTSYCGTGRDRCPKDKLPQEASRRDEVRCGVGYVLRKEGGEWWRPRRKRVLGPLFASVARVDHTNVPSLDARYAPFDVYQVVSPVDFVDGEAHR